MSWKFWKRQPKREVAISAVVIRKDGTREDLGVISRGKVEFTPTKEKKTNG